ncbi:LacI family DNA-binding transcriptional regulator [Aquipuribacter nitratireducens]|uniref:LacI family DNA-binding transcriptional regulator n=1 Tax=Aquipuribacter nitratireducens TaxID=650104 RepID=A0ABW0GP44_9MICO
MTDETATTPPHQRSLTAATATGSAPTLETVAARAGVSRQTVSNALHRPDRLAAATREKVLQAVRETGYRPSVAARQLATRRAQAVAVRADRPQDGISGLVLDAFFHGLAEAGQRLDQRVVLYAQQPDEETELAVVEDVIGSGAADAVVLTATNVHDGRPARLAQLGLTFCAFGRPWNVEEPPHDWVDVDGAAGTEAAVEWLAARGARRIGFLGWPDDGATGADRRAGWLAGLVAAGSPERVEAACENDTDAAQACTAALLDRPDAPDALVCASDTLALGAHRAAAAAGRALTVVGFDATPVTAALGMASVAQPVREAAHACLDLLVPRLRGEQPTPRGVLLAPTLAVPPGLSRA